MAQTKAIVIGTGNFARTHIRAMLEMSRSTRIVGFVEPGEASREAVRAMFAQQGVECPPFYDTLAGLLKAQGSADAAVVVSPHKYHLEHALAVTKAGMDVLIEKPMVMNTVEAKQLMRQRDKTGRLVMVAFPGSLSPAVWEAKKLIAKGTLGKVTAVSAFVYQDWKRWTVNTWRQDPVISGGGFLFDTGSHMVNTVVDLLGEDVARVSALLDKRGTPVEIASTVSGTTQNGVMFSLTGAGDSIQCVSEITVFGEKAILKTGIWGESLSLKKREQKEFVPIKYAASKGPWEQFLKVRAGKMDNPCSPEVGLRFARLMDMIRESADTGITVGAKG